MKNETPQKLQLLGGSLLARGVHKHLAQLWVTNIVYPGGAKKSISVEQKSQYQISAVRLPLVLLYLSSGNFTDLELNR